MASMEDNKRVALDTWRALLRADVRAAFANMTDDVTWRIPGLIAPISGLRRGKGEIVDFLRWAAQAFPEGLRTEVIGAFADGDTVILELVNRSTAANGRPYENEYCFVFDFQDGKICRVREYVDTQKAVAILS